MTESTNANQEAMEEPEPPETADDPLRDAETVVAVFGGVRPMAARLGIAATTIQGWKSRGNIPETRRQAVIEAAQADGLDLTVPQFEDTPEEAPGDAAEAPLAETVTASDQIRQGSTGGGLAWLALIVAIVAVIAQLAFPQWSPSIHGAPQVEVPRDIIDRLDAFERRPKAPDLSVRVVAAERAIDALRQRGSTTAQPDVTLQLRAFSDRIDTLTCALETARLEGRAADDGSAATLLELRGAVEALSQKVEQAVVDTAQTSARKSSIIVAVGALEVALGDGLPYGYALASVQRLAKTDDKDYAESIAVLQTHASTGIPTRSQLASRLDTLIAARGEPVWTAETDSWTDRVLRKVDAVVSIRRLDDDAGTAGTLRQARKALANNDLKGAAETLKGAGGPTGDWARDAARRVAADQALSRLRHWTLKALDAAATETPVTQ